MKLTHIATLSLLPIALITILSACSGQTSRAQKSPGAAQEPGRVVKETDPSIWNIYESRNHVYWFGSDGHGAYSYDGKTLKQYTKADGLCSDRIRRIQEDSIGNIYFDTPEGISKYDGRQFVTLKPVQSAQNHWTLQDGDLWFTLNGVLTGACRYDGEHLYQLNFSELDDQRTYNQDYDVYSIYRSAQGHLWFGTASGGVARYDGRKLEWITERELLTLEDGRVPGVRSIWQDSKGRYWFSNLYYQYTMNEDASGHLAYSKVQCINDQQKAKIDLPYYTSSVAIGDTLWMTYYNEGVWRYDGSTLTRLPVTHNGKTVRPVSLYKDRQGRIWLGTEHTGIFVWNDTAFVQFVP